MLNLGFYNTSGTRTHVRFQFSTHAAAGGNVAPASAFEAADLRIYKAADGAAFSATQRSSANGITMTSPFDSLTGYHDVDIDLTDNTDAGFYASGCLYCVMLSPDTETVDSQTITGVVLAYFEIGVAPVNVTQFGGTAGTFSSGRPEVNMTHIAGSAVSTSTAQLGVNVVNFGGSAGTFASGRPEVNTTHAAGTAWGSGAITAASIATDAITAAKIAADAIGASELATDAVQEIRNAITGGAYALDTDANGRVRIVDGTATGELDTSSGLVTLAASQTFNMTGNITGSLSGSVGSVSGAVGSVTGNVGGNVTGSVGSLATQAKSDVNAEVLDCLTTDTYAEPGQGTPAATASLKDKIGYLYKAWRNKHTSDSTTYKLFNDDASTVDHKATQSDDGTTFTRGEVATGP